MKSGEKLAVALAAWRRFVEAERDPRQQAGPWSEWVLLSDGRNLRRPMRPLSPDYSRAPEAVRAEVKRRLGEIEREEIAFFRDLRRPSGEGERQE